MSGSLIPNGKQQYLDANGAPLAGGKVYYYIPYTTTAKNTWQDINLTILNTNPIILDSAGECIAWGSGAYRQQIYDVNDNLIWDQYTYGISPAGSNFISQEEVQIATQGQVLFTLATITYVPGINSLVVFVNGSKQLNGTNYTETAGNTVTFVTGLNAGDVVDFYASLPATAQNMSNAVTVAYNPPFINSVSTNVQAKLSQTVSVKDFGATGDGTTDDTTAIQNALNTGLDIYVPAGTYLVTNSLTMKTPYQDFFGAGKSSSEIKFVFSSVKPGLILLADATSPSLGSDAEKANVHDLYLHGVTNVLMVIYVKSPFNRIYANRITNNSSVVGHGIYCADLNETTPPLVYSFNCMVYNNYILGSAISGSIGVRLGERQTPTFIKDNNIDNFDVLIEVAGTIASLTISGNYLTPCLSIGVNLNASSPSALFYNVAIINNYFEKCPIAVCAQTGQFNCLRISDNYSYSQTSTSPLGPAPFYWGATSGSAATTQIIIENNSIESHSSFLLLDDQYNSRLASTKNNYLVTNMPWASGTYAVNAYKIRQFNPYFVKTTASGSFLGQSTLRLESKNAVFSIPVQFEPHEKMWKIEAFYGQNSSTGITIELFKSTSAGITATSLGTATRNTDGYLTITNNGYVAEPNYNYYLTVTYDNTGVSGYFYPVQLYLYE